MNKALDYNAQVLESDYYDRYLQHYASRSDEKVKLRELLLGELKRVAKHAFLDVGPGEGELTIPISSLFESTTIIEVNSKFIVLLESKIPNLRVLNTGIEDLKANRKDAYDLILLSHVLYYVDICAWNDVIRVLYSMLAARGMLVVVLNDNTGDWGELIARFKNKYPGQCAFNYRPFSEFISAIETTYQNIKVVPYSSQLTYSDIDSAVEAVLDQLLQVKRADRNDSFIRDVRAYLAPKTGEDDSVVLGVDHKILILFK